MVATDRSRVKRSVRLEDQPPKAGTKVPSHLVNLTGLPRRTARRTVPDMFRRHHTDPDRETASVVSAFHDRLAGSLVTTRTDPPRVDPHNLRDRLGMPAVGLRDRMDRRLVV